MTLGRGYDSAGVGVDGGNGSLVVLREKGKVKRLEELILESKCPLLSVSNNQQLFSELSLFITRDR